MNNNFVVKKIPSEWESVKRGAFIIYLGETDNDAGRRLIVPLRGSKELNNTHYVKVFSGENRLSFGIIGSPNYIADYQMELTNDGDARR